MQFNERDIAGIRALFREVFGEEVDAERAAREARRLLALVEFCVKGRRGKAKE